MRDRHCIVAVISLACMGFLFFGCTTTEDEMEKVVYIANHDSSSVTVIDIEKSVSDPDNAVIITVSIPNSGEPIKGIAVSPDKLKVFDRMHRQSANRSGFSVQRIIR